MSDQEQRLNTWISGLSQEQKDKLIFDLVAEHIECDNIRFPENSKSPYWETCGDPIVEGQSTFGDQNE